MKTLYILILLILFVVSSITFEINVPPQIQIPEGSSYEFSSIGTLETLTYKVDWLPMGARVLGNEIIVEETTALGKYTVRVWASDSSGNIDMKIIVLEIVQK